MRFIKRATIFSILFYIQAAITTSVAATTDTLNIVRPVMSAYTLRAGSAYLADTYLTPIKYSGLNIGIGYERLQAMKFNPGRWVMQLKFNLNIDRTLNKVKNATMWYAGIDFSWGMMHRWRLNHGFSIGAGGSAGVDVGCLYLNRNGNNPASAKAAITVNATGYAAWNGNIWKIPVTLRYQPTLPVIGAFFSPDYGELYYEIYLGNHSGLAHCAWWGNYFKLDNTITADLHFGSTSLRLGYQCNIFSSKVNHIVTHNYTHAAIIGISGEWISLNPRNKIIERSRIISATY